MYRKKNVPLFAIILTLLIFTLVDGASARKIGGKKGLIYERLPRASDIPTPFVFEYKYPFATSGEALDAVKAWNEVSMPENNAKLDEWVAQYEAVLAKAKGPAGPPDGRYNMVLGPYWHPTKLKYCIAWYDTKGSSTTQYPQYELPAPPEFDVEPYEKAISAYDYTMSDGLTKTDWSYLKCVLCYFSPIKNKRGAAMKAQDNEKKLAKMRDEGYVTVTEAQSDLAFTADGFAYFKGLVEKLADFRAANIAIATEKGAITGAEAKTLNDANDKIKAAFLEQLDALKAGPGKAKKTGFFGKMMGKQEEGDPLDWSSHGPKFLLGDFDQFKVDKKGSALSDPPYLRVLESVPVPDMSLDRYFFDPTSGAEAREYHKVQVLCKYLDLDIKFRY